jgi:hypothetical protein
MDNTRCFMKPQTRAGLQGAWIYSAENGPPTFSLRSQNPRKIRISARKTLDYATPNEAFNSLLATLAGGSETQNGGGVRYEC